MEVRDKAIDMVAEEAAANGGEVPRGALSRAAEAVGAVRESVRVWWSEKLDEDEQRTRLDRARRARAEARAAAQEHLHDCVEHLATLVYASLDPSKVAPAVNAIRAVADDEASATDAYHSIQILIDAAPPSEALPPPPTIEALPDADDE